MLVETPEGGRPVLSLPINNTQNANEIYGKGCANCHQQVHGSNHPNGKFFLR